MSLHLESIESVAGKLRAGEVTSVALTQLMLDRIAQFNPQLNAYLTVTADLALQAAAAADDAFAHGQDKGLLQGVPIALKDLVDTDGVRTTGGSRLFEHRIPDTDATVVQKLKDAGAVLLGKTGMHELAYGTTSENAFFGPVRNPWSTDHFSGGSSGGSAAAVAAGLAYGAIGTDTGCSIRQPAHCCGIVGFKPTFGVVSKAGVLPLCWTMDHVGPMTRSVADAAIMFRAIAGFDAADPYSISASQAISDVASTPNVEGLRLGIMRAYFFDADADVLHAIDRALARLEAAGAELVDLTIADVEAASAASRVIFAEALSIHQEQLDLWPDGFGDEVRGKLNAARSITGAQYAEVQHFRRHFSQMFERAFERCDAICTPTALSTAVNIVNPPEGHAAKAWRNTIISDFTGHPSVSIPCGLTAEQLPVGLMLTGARAQDSGLLSLSQAVERVLDAYAVPPGF